MPLRMRTFVAVEVEPFTRDRLVGLQAQLGELADAVKWVEPPNLHLTLAFLGEVDAREIPKVCKAVSGAVTGFEPFTFTVAGLGAFPTPRRPKVLVANVAEGAEQMTALHGAVEAALVETGCYRREERAFTPHVTVGRVRGGVGEGLAPVVQKFAGFSGGQTTVREVRVLSSELKSSGPVYALLGRARLGSR
jgi:2'-5' RNA ligase